MLSPMSGRAGPLPRVLAAVLIGGATWGAGCGPPPPSPGVTVSPLPVAAPSPSATTQAAPIQKPGPAPSPVIMPSPSPGAAVSFRTVAQRENYIADVGSRPSLRLVRTPQDLAFLARVVHPADRPEVESVDLGSEFVVAAFRGQVSAGGGFPIQVLHIQYQPGRVEVTVRLVQPPPDRPHSTAPTHTYHLVAVPRGQIPDAPGTTWIMRGEDGSLLFQTQLP